MTLLVPSQWKNVICTKVTAKFDLNNGALEFRESGGMVEVWQGTRWGHSATQSGSGTKVVIIGEHHGGTQEFEIICVKGTDNKWTHSGELRDPTGGGDGKWTAEESP